ncbi:DUF4390 domain-containing protein [Betaproteobacteria bacterium]|nr:DUF4390 domain-containing protein [Betaproteobacteria bacterium]
MMVFFMRCLRSKGALNSVILLLPVFLFGFYSCSPTSDGKISRITADNVRLVPDSANLALTGDVSVELEKTLIEALKKGVPLQFNSNFRIFKSSFFSTKSLFEKERRAILEYHGITRRFSVNLDGQPSSVYYESLTEALAACLSIKDWVFFSRELLPDKMDGISIQVKLMLNHQALPRPISILASSNQSWQLSSGWVDVFIEERL